MSELLPEVDVQTTIDDPPLQSRLTETTTWTDPDPAVDGARAAATTT